MSGKNGPLHPVNVSLLPRTPHPPVDPHLAWVHSTALPPGDGTTDGGQGCKVCHEGTNNKYCVRPVVLAAVARVLCKNDSLSQEGPRQCPKISMPWLTDAA